MVLVRLGGKAFDDIECDEEVEAFELYRRGLVWLRRQFSFQFGCGAGEDHDITLSYDDG